MTFARNSSHPFRSTRPSSPRHEGSSSPHRATCRPLGSPLGSPRWATRRCSSPTSATDARHEHPHTVRFPSSQLALRRPRGHPTEVGLLGAPNRLATTRPRLDARLTARAQLPPSTHGSPDPFWGWRASRAPSSRLVHLGVDFFGPPRGWRSKSDAPCRAPQRLGASCPEHPRGARTAATVLPSRRAAFPVQSAFPRQVAPKVAAFAIGPKVGNPPPVSRLDGR